MKAEILMIGTELLLGQIEDTNATYMAQVLAENGINLYQKTTVGDNHDRICKALDEALTRSDIVLCSGGLGPTEDDITRECVAEVLERPLEYYEEVFEQIEAMFARFRMRVTENNKKQAYVPKDGIIVSNPHGTAPGIIVQHPRGTVVCMPGVPHELKAMLSEKVIPFLREEYGLTGLIHYRVLRVCGVGESNVDNAIGDLMTDQENPTVGVLASAAAVRIRIAARAESIEEANTLIDEVDAKVRERLPGLIMGVDDETLEGVVNGLLADRGWRIALVETTSGGMIAQRMVAENASQFAGGRVIPLEKLIIDNAKETAFDLARKQMEECSADCALSIVSDAGPGRTVVAFAYPGGQADWEFGRTGSDERLQMRTTIVALEFLRRHLMEA